MAEDEGVTGPRLVAVRADLSHEIWSDPLGAKGCVCKPCRQVREADTCHQHLEVARTDAVGEATRRLYYHHLGRGRWSFGIDNIGHVAPGVARSTANERRDARLSESGEVVGGSVGADDPFFDPR